jgi:putative FmdB family regulatory protein
MPIYEYRCGTCEKEVEVLVRSSAKSPVCPTCGNPLSDKLWSAPNLLSGRTERPAGKTCCGAEERCGSPPCGGGGACKHD